MFCFNLIIYCFVFLAVLVLMIVLFSLWQAAVCRCSQPLSGFSARCLEDESMLQAISKANHNSRFVYVMDTRPKVKWGSRLHKRCLKTKLAEDCLVIFASFPPVLQLNALANRAAGKGYENEDNYSNIRFQFVGIENIHVMRTSLQKLLEGIKHVAYKHLTAL